MGILSGLGDFGLDGLEGMDIYAEDEKEAKKKAAAAAPPKVEEKDLIYDKTFTCPVCGEDFSAKIMKSGKAKLLGTDLDLRARHEGIDSVKYDVLLCPACGYAALSRYFSAIGSAQTKLIKEKISNSVRVTRYEDEVYSYEQAYERYRLSLVCAVVKKAKASEKAYICLKSGWLVRGWWESLQESGGDAKKIEQLKSQEEEYLQNAYKGFVEARQSETFPMCGMDEMTIDYLLAVLAARFKKYDVASRLVSSILASSMANARTKEKARTLKEQIIEDMKKAGH
ncbi:MAG: DUF2225 domain-containing protein [Butyrivibrio sp.]|nr:DUF2225 domain-containing protein [Acetatifactor muris]MCM1559698.1 DUF2225 domain-containing protein [Butyrivibrio sp.]